MTTTCQEALPRCQCGQPYSKHGNGTLACPPRTYDAEDPHGDELERYREALQPFADLADWITENRPDFDDDHYEVQVENWPYTLSVGWLREARAAIAALLVTMKETGSLLRPAGKAEKFDPSKPPSQGRYMPRADPEAMR